VPAIYSDMDPDDKAQIYWYCVLYSVSATTRHNHRWQWHEYWIFDV